MPEVLVVRGWHVALFLVGIGIANGAVIACQKPEPIVVKFTDEQIQQLRDYGGPDGQ